MPQGTKLTYTEVVGQNVARIRMERRPKLTQQEMGEGLKNFFEGQWGKQTVSALERGLRPIEVSELVMLAIVLEVNVETLLAPPGDVDRVLIGQKGRPVKVDEVRGVVAPSGQEQAQEVARKVINALGTGAFMAAAASLHATGETTAPLDKKATRARPRTRPSGAK